MKKNETPFEADNNACETKEVKETKEAKESKRTHYKSFPLSGFTYYDGPMVFSKLKIGKKLKLVVEPENKYDPQAVAVYYKKHKIGFIPRRCNYSISRFLECGIDCFDTRIQYINSDETPENQIGLAVYLKG